MNADRTQRALSADNLSDLQKAMIEQRDKHLEQFMAISGKATFALLTTIFVVYLGAKDFAEMQVKPWFFWVVAALTVVGIILLVKAAYKFSEFHTTRIRSIQRRFFDATNETLTADDMLIIPPTDEENSLVMAGLLCLVSAAVFVLFVNMAIKCGLEIPYLTL